ncbi:hypothetical protein [Kitasatospora sp. NPDC097691]|uniref:hypothetical protein n=1 Tax=Kitasatospora sp. NPDC097691 TaxID=3157231 RepID=UPI00332339A3
MTYERLFALAAARKTSPREVIERLGAYGAELPIVLPEDFTRLDEELFSPDGVMEWGDLRLGDPVPFARLILAARLLRRRPAELAGHLRARGIVPSSDDLPDGLTMEQALELLKRSGSWSMGLLWVEDLSLADLLRLSLRTGHPMAKIVEWYRSWGLPVPDLAEWIREALARVPLVDPS